MNVKTRRVFAKSALTRTRIPSFEYCLNPYTGCGHGCLYCYAALMKRFFGHPADNWGSFVDVKVNAPELLAAETRRRKKGEVIVSSVTDPYQPLEKTHGITRRCLEILLEAQWPVTVQTRSSLITRDIDLISAFRDIQVGITVTTDSDAIRKIIEPFSSPVSARIRALEKLKAAGVPTYAFVGPILPMNPQALAKRLEPLADEVLIDRMNYCSSIMSLFRKRGWEFSLHEEFVNSVADVFRETFGSDRVSVLF